MHKNNQLQLGNTFLSQHAQQRMAQRNVKVEDIEFVLNYGARYHVAGSTHVYLRRKDIPKQNRKKPKSSKLEGLTVVLCRDESTVLTVWRNRQNGNKRIRKKPAFGW